MKLLMASTIIAWVVYLFCLRVLEPDNTEMRFLMNHPYEYAILIAMVLVLVITLGRK